MKILCVIDNLGSGGAQRQLVNLGIGFREKGHEVTFLVYHRTDFYKSLLDEKNIQVHYVIESNYFKRLFKMRRFIRSGNFDNVLSFLESPNLICEFSTLPYKKWKLLVGERSADPKISQSFKLRSLRLAHVFADKVVANSYSNIELVKKANPFLAAKKCRVIYNIIDFEKWQPNNEISKLAINEKFKLLIAASHRELKNLNGLIDAVHLLKSEEKDRLEIKWFGDVHDGSLDAARKNIQMFNLESNFQFYPATNKILPEMQQADALGVFSWYEGFPNVICEAMSCGKPILSTPVSDVPLILKNQTQFLCASSDPADIAVTLSVIMKTSKNELQIIGAKNRETAKEFFQKEKIVDEYLEILQN